MENGRFVTTAEAGEGAAQVQAQTQTEVPQKEESGLMKALKVLGGNGDGKEQGEAVKGSSAGTTAGASDAGSGSAAAPAGTDAAAGTTSASKTDAGSAVAPVDGTAVTVQGTTQTDMNALVNSLVQNFASGTCWGEGCSGGALKATEAALGFLTTANTYTVRNIDDTQLANACLQAYAALGSEEKQIFAANWATIAAYGDTVLNNPAQIQGELEDSGCAAAAQTVIAAADAPQNWSVLKSVIQVNCIG
jgi:hypothetical protein